MTARRDCGCIAELLELRAAVAGLDASLRECLSLLRATARPGPAAPPSIDLSLTAQGNRQSADYQQLVERLTAVVVELVPAGSGVLVVSRGDDRLLSLEGRPAGHFPQAVTGTYAGHHPDDSAAAIAELERLVEAGWRYLVFPSTALWWLDHYGGLRRHLEGTGRLLLREPGLGVVYGLAATAPLCLSTLEAPP